MKIAAVAAFASFIASSDAAGFRDIVNRVTQSMSDVVYAPAEGEGADAPAASDEEGGRQLQIAGCWGNSGSTPQKWHPTYSAGWTNGYCRFTQDCNSPGYSTQLACCKGAYSGQISGFCLSQLPNPPTSSPTAEGGLDVFYPDYSRPWPSGQCINDGPLPSGRPTYTTMLACCKGAYAGQMSGNCLMQLPNPPTGAPTNSAFEADFFYPQYELPWSSAGCSNSLPLPYPNVNDRPNYPTQLACCKGAYAGQMSGVCLAQLPSPPTTSPTGSGGYDFFYPDYETPWSHATCKNSRPLPFVTGGRPTYSTMLACCKGAYGGQTSGACLAALPSPPTSSPTEGGGLDVWYPNYNQDFASGMCINDAPLPSGRPAYPTRVACCNTAYGGQTSNVCQCAIDSCYSCNCPGATTTGACPSLTCS